MLRRTFALTSIAFALSWLAATDAGATAQRTFVASNGLPANTAFNCSISKPCRAFSDAISVTSTGGEVIVLDSAGYGPVIIAQSVSIIAPSGVYAGISVPAFVTGVAITGAGISVVLRGLAINSTGGDGYGIRMVNGTDLAVERCAISNFGTGYGLSIETAAAVKIAGSVISNNRYGAVVGFGATVNITNSQVIKNAIEGIEIFGGPSGTTTNIFIADTLVTGSGSTCIDNYAQTGTVGNISATRVTVTDCALGIVSEPSGAGTITVSNSMVTGNGVGFEHDTGTFNSLGTSQVSGNTTDIVGTITLIGGK